MQIRGDALGQQRLTLGKEASGLLLLFAGYLVRIGLLLCSIVFNEAYPKEIVNRTAARLPTLD